MKSEKTGALPVHAVGAKHAKDRGSDGNNGFQHFSPHR